MADNTVNNNEQAEQDRNVVTSTVPTGAPRTNTPVTQTRNANGLTAEEEAEYNDFYTKYGEYHPEQPIPRGDRTFGIIEEENPFLSNEANDGWTEDMLLGTLNMPCEYNHTVPQGTSLDRKEQQKLFHSAPTQSIVALTSLHKEGLKKLKRETGHLLGCNL